MTHASVLRSAPLYGYYSQFNQLKPTSPDLVKVIPTVEELIQKYTT